MKTIGIKLADGSFYPVLEEGKPCEKTLDLTTAHNNQTKVMVDLYRSANCTMDDAEYVDSLQIENLNERPNGEPDISFLVSIDENNELSAKIIDSETGKESDTIITLVSRTVEERLFTDEYNISDTIVEDSNEEEKDNSREALIQAGVIAGNGLLAAASAINKKDQEISEDDFTLGDPEANAETTDEIAVTEEEPVFAEETSVTEEEVTFDETPADSFDLPETEDNLLDTPSEEIEIPEVPETSEEPVSTDSDTDLPDFSEFEDNSEEKPEFDTESFDFDLPESTDGSEDTIATDDFETTEPEVEATETIEDSLAVKEAATDFSLDDSDFDLSAETSSIDFDENPFDSDNSNDVTIEESSLPDLDFNMPAPDFDTEETSENTELPPEDDYSLPDFNEIPDIADTTDSNISTSLDSIDSINDDMFASSTDDTPASGSGISFTGLYDKETELGESSSFDEEEIHKKTKVPVIICVVCAIICILATLLILFIIPSKYNLISKKDSKKTQPVVEEVIESPVVEEEETDEDFDWEEPEPETIPEAAEDEVIIIEKAEEVVPVPPTPVVEEEKPQDIRYKIKWGDTLWDIADTYYKNPWKYKYIARWNGIKDPDYIISGRYITIPAE